MGHALEAQDVGKRQCSLTVIPQQALKEKVKTIPHT
jgi:hypothetical protein